MAQNDTHGKWLMRYNNLVSLIAANLDLDGSMDGVEVTDIAISTAYDIQQQFELVYVEDAIDPVVYEALEVEVRDLRAMCDELMAENTKMGGIISAMGAIEEERLREEAEDEMDEEFAEEDDDFAIWSPMARI